MVFVEGNIALGNSYSIDGWIRLFLMGDYGPGGYYYGIMLQFLLVFPLIYKLVKKYDFDGVIIVGIGNLFFELLFQAYNIDVAIYRILIFKYILFIAGGIYLYIHKAEKIKSIYLMLLLSIGALYLLAPEYWGYEYKVFKYWSPTSMVVIAWIYPILFFLLANYDQRTISNCWGRLIGKIGKASYHIMCTQMLWYDFRGELVYKYYDLSKLGSMAELSCSVAFSVLSGLLFYKLHYIVQSKFQKYRRSNRG